MSILALENQDKGWSPATASTHITGRQLAFSSVFDGFSGIVASDEHRSKRAADQRETICFGIMITTCDDHKPLSGK